MRPDQAITILIVDDEPDNLQAIVDAFRASNRNYSILRAPNGQVAMQMAVKRNPQLIITDWEMPVLNGIEFIRQLRLDERTADIPVIMCTGVMLKSENLQTALEAGASDYIRKPIDRIELIARTHSMLQLGESFQTIKVQNQQLKETMVRIERLARTDPLTQLSNRRDILEKLKLIVNTADRHRRSFSLVLGDIDHFKLFNDQFGHDCGDFVLRSTGELITSNLREQDLVGRWGGEEFLLVLPETDAFGAQIIAEKIRKTLQDHVFEFEKTPLHIRMTFGVAEYECQGSVDACLKRADQALYRGKEKGRNQVCLDSSE